MSMIYLDSVGCWLILFKYGKDYITEGNMAETVNVKNINTIK